MSASFAVPLTARHRERWFTWAIAMYTEWLLLAKELSALMRCPAPTLESGFIDASTTLYNLTGFIVHGDEMLAACQSEGRPISVVVFDCTDLLEVRAIYGTRTARKLATRIVSKLSALSGDGGLAARTGPAEFTVVLTGMTRDKALAAIHRVLGNPGRIELDGCDSEIVVVPSFLVENAGCDTGSVEELRGELSRELARQQAYEKRRQLHMRRRRERHSRPMGLVTRTATSSPSTPGTGKSTIPSWPGGWSPHD